MPSEFVMVPLPSLPIQCMVVRKISPQSVPYSVMDDTKKVPLIVMLISE